MALQLISPPRISWRKTTQLVILISMGMLVFLLMSSPLEMRNVCPAGVRGVTTDSHIIGIQTIHANDKIDEDLVDLLRNIAEPDSEHISVANNETRHLNDLEINVTATEVVATLMPANGSLGDDKSKGQHVGDVTSHMTTNVTSTPRSVRKVGRVSGMRASRAVKGNIRYILSNHLSDFYGSARNECSTEPARANTSQSIPGLSLCQCFPEQLAERTNVSLEHLLHVSWSDVEVALTGISPGGHWRPTHCAPLRRVAVIIPFRDRGNHLRAFLLHTHPILQKQAVEYKIFVVEQNMPYIFNKGSLMNVGYIEVVEKSGFHPDCLVFHDVDLLMESERNIFMCREVPTHQAAYVDKFNYTLPYIKMFGGAVAIRPDQFVTLNGYSNQFVGWGGEDDDFFRRVYSKFRKFHRPPEEISRYTMIPHIRDSANPVNRNSSKGYKTPVSSFQDGLKTVEYDRLSLDVFPTHTRILVDLPLLKLSKTETLPEETIPRKDYESRKGQRCSDTVARDSYVSKVTCEYLCTASVKCPFYQFTQYSQQDDLCQIFNTTCSKVVEHEATDMFVLRTS